MSELTQRLRREAHYSGHYLPPTVVAAMDDARALIEDLESAVSPDFIPEVGAQFVQLKQDLAATKKELDRLHALHPIIGGWLKQFDALMVPITQDKHWRERFPEFVKAREQIQSLMCQIDQEHLLGDTTI